MRNTSHLGEISRTQIIAALDRQGKGILVPLGDHYRYDLVIDDNGRFLRVQCKTGRLRKGAVVFHASSVDSRSTPGRTLRKHYKDQIEVFGVYCPDNDKCYLVPVGAAPRTTCSLRVDRPRNDQKTHLRWAEDFEMKG
jgi:hypothetical protein